MTDKLVVEIDSKDAELAMQNLDRLTSAAVQMGKAFENTRGATSALKELRQLLVGIKGKGSALEELTASIKNLNTTTDSLKKSFAGSVGHLGKILKNEMAELKSIVQESGLGIGKAATAGLDAGMDGAVAVIKRQGKTIAAAAKAEATRVYEAMVAGQANAKIKDVGALFKLDEAGATLSPYHKQVLDNWKKSSAETFRAMKVQLATEREQLEGQVKAENEALQSALKRMEDESKTRNASLTSIYRSSLSRGNSSVSQVRTALKAEAAQLQATVKSENDALQTALQNMESNSRDKTKSLTAIYRDSLGRGNFAVAQVKSKLKAESSELQAIVQAEESELQRALQAMEASDKLRKSSLSEIYAGSLKRGDQGIARVKAQLREQADNIIQANKTELSRIQTQVAAATNNAAGLYQKYNPQSGAAGPVVDPTKIGQVNQLSKAFKQLTVDGNDAHSMARGLASGFNLLWLTWGNLAPLFAGASISFGIKKTFDIGSEVEYQVKMMETLGQTTQNQSTIIRQALRDIDQTTQFSLIELSQAMVRLGQAGQTPKEALETLRPAADLASVGMVDLKIATDLLIQTQALFGKSTADAGKIAAQLFEITKSGVLNVEDIGGSMKYASEANTRFGKSLEETLAILGGLAQAGIKAGSGGTAYINFLRDLNGRSTPAINAMKKLGEVSGKTIEVFKANGEQRSAIDIFNDIAAAADKLKDKDADKLLAKIFSDRGGRTFFAMVREGTIDLAAMVKKLEEVKPESLFQAAKGLMDTTKGALNILQGALVGALDKVFEENELKFKTFITDVTAVINSPEFGTAIRGMVAAVGSLYESIKTLLPVLEVLGTAWLVFKAASLGVTIFQGLAVAIAGMAPVLGMTIKSIAQTTGALITSTAAWSANGVAMIGNTAASRAAASGMDAVGVAAARAAATTAVAGVGMRGLSVLLGFLANPIVGVITTIGLLGAAFWSAKSDAEAATAGVASSVVKNGRVNIAQWNEEIKKLRERNALMKDTFTPLDEEINEARRAQQNIEKDAKTQREKVDAFGGKAFTYAQAREIQKLNMLTDKQLQGQRAINQMQLDLSKIRADERNKELDETLKRQRGIKVQGDVELDPSGGGRPKFVEQIRIANDNELKEIEKRNNTELGMMQALSANAQKILDARHQAGLLSEGEYQAQLFAEVRQSEADQLAMLEESKTAYAKALADRESVLQAALTKATNLKDSTQIDKFTQELDNLSQTAKTFYDGINTSIVKLADNGITRMQLASIKAQAAIKKLADTEREFWKKDSEEVSKLKTLEATAAKYKNINESVFSLDAANKAAAETGAAETEKFNAKLSEMDYAYETAESAALSFMTTNIMALASGDAEATELYNNLRNIVTAMKDARDAAGLKAETSIRDRSLIAFEKARQAQIDAFSNGLADAVETSIFEGGKAGGQKFIDVIRSELLRKPLVAMIRGVMGDIVGGIFGGSGGGGGIAGAMGGGAGGISGIASNISSLYSGYTGLTSGQGVMGSIGSWFGLGSGTGAGAGATAVNGLSALTPVTIGSNTSAVASVSAGGGAGSGAMAGAGAFAAVAGLVLNALGAFKSERKNAGGLAGTLGSGQINAWEEWREGGTLFSGPSFNTFDPTAELEKARTKLTEARAAGDLRYVALQEMLIANLEEQYGGLAEATAAQSKIIQASYTDMRNNAVSMAQKLGISSAAVAEFTTKLGGEKGLSLDGLNLEEQQAKIAEALATANNELAQQVIGTWDTSTTEVTKVISENIGSMGEDASIVFSELSNTITTTRYVASEYAKDGEKAIDTLIRLSTSLETVTNMAGALGYTFNEASLAAANAASNIVDAFGGLEAFTETLGSYFQNFYSDAEQKSATAREVAGALSKAGFEIDPALLENATRPAIRAFVESVADQFGFASDEYVAVVKQANVLASITEALPSATAAIEDNNDALDDARKTAEDAAAAWKAITDALLSDRTTAEIALLRALGKEEEAVSRERAIAIEGFDAYQISLYDGTQSILQQITAIETATEARERETEAVAALFSTIDSSVARFLSGDTLRDFQSQRQSDKLRELGFNFSPDEIQNASAETIKAVTLAIMNMGDVSTETKNEIIGLANSLLDTKEAAQQAAVAAVENAFRVLETIINTQRTSLVTTETEIKSVFDLLSSSVKELFGEVADAAEFQASQAREFISAAVKTAKETGKLPESKRLQDAVTAARAGLNAQVYASQAEADFANLVLANELRDLQDISGDQLTEVQRQIRALDDILANAKSQLLAIQGVDTSITTLSGAIAKMGEAIADALKLGVKPGTGGIVTAPSSKTEYSNEVVRDATGFVRDSVSSGNLTAIYQGAKANGLDSKDTAYLLQLSGYDVSQQDVVKWALDNGLPAFDGGTNYVPRDMLAVVHKGEEIVPAKYNVNASSQAAAAGGSERTDMLLEALLDAMDVLAKKIDVTNSNTGSVATTLNDVKNGNALTFVPPPEF